MRKLNILSILMVGVIALSSCTSEEQKEIGQYNKITPEKAREMMDSESVLILDVRTYEEFKERRIEGALLIPDYEIQKRAEKELPDKDKLILVYCRSGRRSANAAMALINLGYTGIYDFGGINSWPYETESGN